MEIQVAWTWTTVEDVDVVYEGFVDLYDAATDEWTLEFEDDNQWQVELKDLRQAVHAHRHLAKDLRGVSRWQDQNRLRMEMQKSFSSAVFKYQMVTKTRGIACHKVSCNCATRTLGGPFSLS